MVITVRIIGIVFVLASILYLLKPLLIKRIMEFFKWGSRIYLVGIIRLVLAVVFLLAARECKYFWVIFALGILLLISGVLVFILGPKKIRPILEWFQKQSILFLRLLSIIALAIGIVIIIAA